LYEFKMRELPPTIPRGATGAVTVTTIAPSPALRPYLRRFEIVETRAPISRVLFPETGLVLGVRFAGESAVDGSPVPTGAALLTGLRVKARRMETAGGSGVVVAKFTETGAAAFLDLPLHELFGAVVPLEELLSALAVERLVEEVRCASTSSERVAAMERFLASRLRPRPDPLVSRAARALRESRGSARIAPLARDLGVSQEVLEKRFRRQLGATPKQFASILRFRRAIEVHRSARDLGALAQEAGYYDQAHFNRQFRFVTGSAPGALLTSDEYC
jgi:AraC-like DNA-binding protein